MAVYGGFGQLFYNSTRTPEQIRSHVYDVFDKLGRPDGGLIMSTHDIPLGTPREKC